MRDKPIRAGKRWFEFRDILQQNGVKASHRDLTDSVAEFMLRENLLPVIVRRAKRKKERLLF